MKIVQLKVGDRVRARMTGGEVVGFSRDAVLIKWDGDDGHSVITDEGLKTIGVEKASAFVAEDTRPE